MGYMCSICLIILFFTMLFFPIQVLTGATDGLLLWFNIVLPTLFPFILICNLCVRTKVLKHLIPITRPLFGRIFGISPHSSFAVLTGFLCGYPMGSKVAADLYRQGLISQEECSYLVSFCNNSSPMFIVSFLMLQNLKAPSMVLPTVSILLLSPVLCSFFFRFSRSKKALPELELQNAESHAVPNSDMSLVLDEAIFDALETIAKIGAYIIIFSVFTQLLAMIPLRNTPGKLLLLSSLEITKGITLICDSSLSWNVKYILCLFLTSFGGICAAAQTHSMLTGTGISIAFYLTEKLVTALVTSLIGCFFLLL